MPGPLKRFKRDPNGKGRGGGLYYHRGHGYWSKYSWGRDAKKKNRKGSRMVKKKPGYGHTLDSRIVRRKGKKLGRI